jgi:Transglutaminase-like superfamily
VKTTMARLYLHALWQILRFEFCLFCGDFALLHGTIRACPLSASTPKPRVAEEICKAVDLVCVCYPKRVLCLQRSAATACLLKRNGIPARMIIGVQGLPFKAHAWVEVDGRVVNDKPYVRDTYAVLDSC